MEKKLLLIETTKAFFEENGRFPSLAELAKLGIKRKLIRVHFNDLASLIEATMTQLDEPLFTEERADSVIKAIKEHKRFVITTAVVGAKVDRVALAAIKTYCKKNNATLLVVPCADPAASVSDGIDPLLLEENIVFDNVDLNSNIMISSIKISAKQIMPHTGLGRFGQRNKSMILASPKQNLEFIAVANNKIPHALMTTGAITLPSYATKRYMSLRTSYIAEHDHVMGALIVEIVNNQIYHFRQVQFKNGGFIDLGVKYTKKGISKVSPEAIVLGDLHITHTCPVVESTTYKMLSDLKPKNIVLHDSFNGLSISHHLEKKSITKARLNPPTLKDELDANKLVFKKLKKYGKIVVVKSNHDIWIDRYLDDGRYVFDHVNLKTALELALAKVNGNDPYEYYIDDKDIRFLKRDEDFIIQGIQLGSHGDVEGSLVRVEKSFGKAIVGHSHSGAILRGVYRVGTSTELREDYVQGATNWTNTHCLLYPDGSRQLINIISGDYRLEAKNGK